jgi:hypothetical protein
VPVDLDEADIPIVGSLMQYDLHNFDREFINRIKARARCAISTAYRPTVADFSRESWLEQGAYSISSEDAINFQFALMPQCIAPEEFAVVKKKL